MYFLALCLVSIPVPGPQPRFLALDPNLYLPALALNLHLQALGPKFLFTRPGLQFILPVRNLSLHLPTFFPNLYLMAMAYDLYYQYCSAWICIYVVIGSSSIGSSNISSVSNFFGLDNTNISMPILVNYGKQFIVCTYTDCDVDLCAMMQINVINRIIYGKSYWICTGKIVLFEKVALHSCQLKVRLKLLVTTSDFNSFFGKNCSPVACNNMKKENSFSVFFKNFCKKNSKHVLSGTPFVDCFCYKERITEKEINVVTVYSFNFSWFFNESEDKRKQCYLNSVHC